MRMTRASVGLAVVALLVAACGSDTSEPAPGGDGGGGAGITVVGENVAFDTTSLTASAGEQVTITFENRDTGIRHNLRIEGPTGPIATKIEAGPKTQTLSFTIDEPGTYQFLCEVHPVQMVGQLVIEG